MDDEGQGRACGDCAPPLWIQGGDWGWRSHRHWLHGEGPLPEDNPYPRPPGARPLPPPRSEAEKAESRRRRAAASVARARRN